MKINDQAYSILLMRSYRLRLFHNKLALTRAAHCRSEILLSCLHHLSVKSNLNDQESIVAVGKPFNGTINHPCYETLGQVNKFQLFAVENRFLIRTSLEKLKMPFRSFPRLLCIVIQSRQIWKIIKDIVRFLQLNFSSNYPISVN